MITDTAVGRDILRKVNDPEDDDASDGNRDDRWWQCIGDDDDGDGDDID